VCAIGGGRGCARGDVMALALRRVRDTAPHAMPRAGRLRRQVGFAPTLRLTTFRRKISRP
jgi:hypothetical protein